MSIRRRVLVLSCSAAWVFAGVSAAYAEMTVRLKDGKVLSVPVKACDIQGISFDDGDGPSRATFLSDLEPITARVGAGTLEKDTAVGKRKIVLGGVTHEKGLYTHANASVVFALDGRHARFESQVGLWDSGNPNRGVPGDVAGKKGSVVFKVLLDGREAYNSGPMGWDRTSRVSIAVGGAQRLELVVEDGGDGPGWDWAVWGDAKLR